MAPAGPTVPAQPCRPRTPLGPGSGPCLCLLFTTQMPGHKYCLCLGSVRCLWAWWDGAAGVRVPARPPTHCLPRPGLLRPGLAWPAATCPGLPAPPNPAKILFLLKINLSVTEGFSGPERAVEVLGSGVPGRGEAQREGTCGPWDLLSWAHFPPSGDF